MLNYLIGGGATGYVQGLDSPLSGGSFAGPPPPIGTATALFISGGTDSIGRNLVAYILHPDAVVTFFKSEFPPAATPSVTILYEESLELLLGRSVAVASTYFVFFVALGLYAFKRAQVIEKA